MYIDKDNINDGIYFDLFTRIQVKEDESQELRECVQDLNTNIVIANGIIGNVTKEGFLEGGDIIQGINLNWTKNKN